VKGSKTVRESAVRHQPFLQKDAAMSRIFFAFCLITASSLLFASCATVPAGNAESGYAIHGFVGKNSQTAAAGTTVLLMNGSTGKALATDTADFFGKFSFQGLQPDHYQLKVGEIIQDVVLGSENIRRDIDLSNPSGTMNYADVGTKELEEQVVAAASGKAAPAGPNDENLAAEMAGTWWGYSGSTETKIGLCPDGSFSDFSEFGYSGTMSDAGGNQTGAWGNAGQSSGQGSWVIQGNNQEGSISVRYNDGSTKTIAYYLANDDGCFKFNGSLVCRTLSQCE